MSSVFLYYCWGKKGRVCKFFFNSEMNVFIFYGKRSDCCFIYFSYKIPMSTPYFYLVDGGRALAWTRLGRVRAPALQRVPRTRTAAQAALSSAALEISSGLLQVSLILLQNLIYIALLTFCFYTKIYIY